MQNAPAKKHSLLFPGRGKQQNQNGEQLQAAGQHIEYENDLRKGIVERKITGGTDLVKTGPCVVDGLFDGGEISCKAFVVQREQQKGKNIDANVADQEDHRVVDHRSGKFSPIQSDDSDFLWVNQPANKSVTDLKVDKQTADLDTTASAAAAGADAHDAKQDGLGKSGPKVEVAGGKAGGGHHTGYLKRALLETVEEGTALLPVHIDCDE